MASVAYCSEVPTWLVAGRGRRLPEPLFTTMSTRLADVRVPWEADAEPMPLALFGTVVGTDRRCVDATEAGVLDAECAMAHELVKSSPM